MTTNAVTVELNGETVALPGGASLAEAVARVGAERAERGVAVAVDGEVVPKSAWGEVTLAEGQRIEVVRAIQGG